MKNRWIVERVYKGKTIWKAEVKNFEEVAKFSEGFSGNEIIIEPPKPSKYEPFTGLLDELFEQLNLIREIDPDILIDELKDIKNFLNNKIKSYKTITKTVCGE